MTIYGDIFDHISKDQTKFAIAYVIFLEARKNYAEVMYTDWSGVPPKEPNATRLLKIWVANLNNKLAISAADDPEVQPDC